MIPIKPVLLYYYAFYVDKLFKKIVNINQVFNNFMVLYCLW